MVRGLKPPASIRISGCEWAVEHAEIENAYGQSEDTRKVITLNPDANLHPFNAADTFLHEVMHSVLRQQGRHQGDDAEEVYVRALATGLIGVFADNPAVLDYLRKATRA